MAGGRAVDGYSLVELLVVLAVVGVLAALGGTYQWDRQSPAVKGVSASVAAALMDARTLARGSGQAVTLLPSGTGASLRLDYQTTSGVQGAFLMSENGAQAYCAIDGDGSSVPTSTALSSLKDALAHRTDAGAVVLTDGLWSTNAFKATSGLQIRPDGLPNKEAFVAVGGATSGRLKAAGPTAIVLLSADGSVARYFRADPSAAWVKL